MMTEAQLEAAARELCRLRGVDPDKSTGHGAEPGPSGATCDVWMYSPAWCLAVKEVRARNIMDEAIAAGKAHQG